MEEKIMKEAFCNKCSLSTSIPEMVAKCILGSEQDQLVKMRYNDMKENYNKSCEEWQKYFNSNKTDLKTFNGYTDTISAIIPINHNDFNDDLLKKGAIGIDLPTWFNIKEDTEQQRIMFIAQDPLRGNKWYGGNGKVSPEDEIKYPNRVCENAILSSPFGLHDQGWRSKGNGGGLVYGLVAKCVENNYGVYLTDSRKYFVYDHKTTNKYSTKHRLEAYKTILSKEIDYFKPTLIVCMGNTAGELCEELQKSENLFFIKLPHLSGLGRAAIKKAFNIEHATNEAVIDKYLELIQESFTTKKYTVL